MPERHWVGNTNGTWNSAANWSATQGGLGGAGVPTSLDDVYIDKGISVTSYINVNQDIATIKSLTFSDYSTGSVGWFLGGGTNTTTTGTTWSVPNNITINTASGTAVYGILNMSLSGGSNIIKTGGGGLLRTGPTTGSWGTTTFDLQGGYIGGQGVNNTTGTGTITMSDGTGITNASSVTSYSLANPLVVNGNIYLNVYLDNVSATIASLTLSGTVDLGGAVRTINVGSTTGNDATISGLISGTGGFIKDGTGTLTITGNNTGLTGSAAISGGILVTGSFSAATDGIPAISSFTVTSGAVYTYSTSNSPRTFDVTINSATPSNFYTGSSFFGTGGVSSTDTVLHTYTGTISGVGAFIIHAPGGGVAATRYVRTKSSSLPATLGFSVNSVTANGFRRGTYEWGGGNYDVGTNVLLDALDSDTATSNDVRGIFSIVHRGTADTEFVLNDINKTSGTAFAYGAYLRFGSASDTGDIKVKGVISQSVSSLGIDKQGGRKLTLSGANTYTFNTLLSAGELVIANQNAIQNSTLFHQTSGTTLSFDPALSAATFGGLSGTAVVGVTLTIPSGFNLSVGNNNADTTYSNLLSSSSGTLTKVGTGDLYLLGNSTGFTGNITVSNGILYTSTSATATDYGLPSASNITTNSSGRVDSYNASNLTISSNITINTGTPANLSSGDAFYTGSFTATGSNTHDFTGTLSGTGAFVVFAASFGVNATRYSRAKSSSLPATLGLFASAPTYQRRATYEWTGGNYDVNTNVILDAGPSATTASNDARSLFRINNIGTLDTELVFNNINKISYSSDTHGSYLIFGSSSDTGDIKVKGVISQSILSLGIDKQGPRKLTLTGTNTFTFNTILTAGTLNIQNASALGSSAAGDVTLTAGTLEIQGGVNVNKGTPTFALNGSLIKNVSDANTLTTGTATMGAATTFEVAGGSSLTFPGVISGSNTSYSITKTGGGTLRLSSVTSNYIGPTVVSAGTLEFASINDAGSALNSSLGKPAVAQSDITLGATGDAGLSHIGSTAVSTNRNLIFSGGNGTTLTIYSSGAGSGAITYSSGGSLSFTGAGEHTINFDGTNSNVNTFARTIADGPSGSTYIQKFDTNTWVLSTITATGTAACYGGVLNFGSANVTTISTLFSSGGTIAITNGNTIAANTVMTGEGTITAVLTGNKTLLVDSSSTEVYKSTLQPDDTNGNNSFTGAVTVSGCVDLVTPDALTPSTLGTAKVLGASNTVTVDSTGIIRTKHTTSSNQKGSARYHNLTLQGGSKIKVGLAA